jgi:hypothetical protein
VLAADACEMIDRDGDRTSVGSDCRKGNGTGQSKERNKNLIKLKKLRKECCQIDSLAQRKSRTSNRATVGS